METKLLPSRGSRSRQLQLPPEDRLNWTKSPACRRIRRLQTARTVSACQGCRATIACACSLFGSFMDFRQRLKDALSPAASTGSDRRTPQDQDASKASLRGVRRVVEASELDRDIQRYSSVAHLGFVRLESKTGLSTSEDNLLSCTPGSPAMAVDLHTRPSSCPGMAF